MTTTYTVNNREKFLEDVMTERAKQDSEWGSAYDRNHSINDWAALICHHATKVVEGGTSQYDAMIVVAALACAAGERMLTGDGPALRHYDEP